VFLLIDGALPTRNQEVHTPTCHVNPPPRHAQAAASEAAIWLQQHGKPAGMGTTLSGGRWVAGDARGDINSWVTPRELHAGGCPVLAAVLAALEAQLRQQLSAQRCVGSC